MIRERVSELLEEIGTTNRRTQSLSAYNRVFVGADMETDKEVFWDLDPSYGATNPHMLILGESGFGKTYTISCLLTERVRSLDQR